jgi:hypothetical protein
MAREKWGPINLLETSDQHSIYPLATFQERPASWESASPPCRPLLALCEKGDSSVHHFSRSFTDHDGSIA